MAKRRKSALVELRRLEEAFNKNRMEILSRAKDEAAGAVRNIVKQLQIFANDFPDVVADAVSHLADFATPKAKPAPAIKSTPQPAKVSKFKSKPKTATAAQIKSVGDALGKKDGVANHHLVQVTKLNGGVVSAALRQLRSEGKAKSSGQGRATTWTALGK